LPPDPLSEAPDAVWYVRAPNGGQYGPAAADVMRGWLEEGRVSPDSLVWREGWRDWQPGAQVFAQLGGGPFEPELGAIADGNATSANRNPGASRRPSRSRSTALNALILAVLVLAVIVLLVVFIWVLNRGPAGDGGSSEGTAAVETRSAGSSVPALPIAAPPRFAP
jgi:hypothetical protein